MANLMPEVALEMAVGDTKALSHLFQKSTRIDVQGLTGYAAWCTFNYVNAAPHVIRACKVDETNGLAIYEMKGDELTAEGTVEFQFTVMDPNGYTNSSDILRIRVMRKPT